jgi:hypothetical protein
MLSDIATTFASLFHLLGLCAMLIGAFQLLMAILGSHGPNGYVKGIALILIGAWVGSLGRTEVPSFFAPHAPHPPAITTAAPGGHFRT